MKDKNVYLYKEIVKKFQFRNIWSVRDFCKRNNIKRKVIEGIVLDEFIEENSERFNKNKLPYKVTLVDKKDFEQIYYKKKMPFIAELVKTPSKIVNNPILNILKELLQKIEHLEYAIKDISNDKKKKNLKLQKKDNNEDVSKTIKALNQIEKIKKRYTANSYEEYVLEKDEINKLIKALRLSGNRLRLYYSCFEYITGIDLKKYKENFLAAYSLKNVTYTEKQRMSYIKNVIIEDPALRKPFLKFLREKEKEMIKTLAS